MAAPESTGTAARRETVRPVPRLRPPLYESTMAERLQSQEELVEFPAVFPHVCNGESQMTDAILLMLATGVLWALVGVVFGSAPSDRDRMFSFFALYQTLFAAFVFSPTMRLRSIARVTISSSGTDSSRSVIEGT